MISVNPARAPRRPKISVMVETNPRVGYPKVARRVVWRRALWSAGVYTVAIFAVFDIARPDFRFDIDNSADGTLVAIGLWPRGFACTPAMHDIDYLGDELVFPVLMPACLVWCAAMGYLGYNRQLVTEERK